jgi:hypothetical protein
LAEHVNARRRSETHIFLLANLNGRNHLEELVVDDSNKKMCLKKLGVWAWAGMK